METQLILLKMENAVLSTPESLCSAKTNIKCIFYFKIGYCHF